MCLTHLRYRELFSELSCIVQSPKQTCTRGQAMDRRTVDAQLTTEAGSVSVPENNLFYLSLPWTRDVKMDDNPSTRENRDKTAPDNILYTLTVGLWSVHEFGSNERLSIGGIGRASIEAPWTK